MASSDLDRKSKELEKRLLERNRAGVTAMRLDILYEIISSLKGDRQVSDILGEPVLEKLAIVFEKESEKVFFAQVLEEGDEVKSKAFTDALSDVLSRVEVDDA